MHPAPAGASSADRDKSRGKVVTVGHGGAVSTVLLRPRDERQQRLDFVFPARTLALECAHRRVVFHSASSRATYASGRNSLRDLRVKVFAQFPRAGARKKQSLHARTPAAKVLPLPRRLPPPSLAWRGATLTACSSLMPHPIPVGTARALAVLADGVDYRCGKRCACGDGFEQLRQAAGPMASSRFRHPVTSAMTGVSSIGR